MVAPSLLNVCVTDGATVVATRVVLGEGKAASLYFTSGSAWLPRAESRRAASSAVAAVAHGAAIPDVEFCMEQSDRRERAVIVASERLTLAAEDWLPVPPNTILVVHPHGPVLLVPVRFDEPVAPSVPAVSAAPVPAESAPAAPSAGKRRRHSCDETSGSLLLAAAAAAGTPSAKGRFIVTAAELDSAIGGCAGAADGGPSHAAQPAVARPPRAPRQSHRGGDHGGRSEIAQVPPATPLCVPHSARAVRNTPTAGDGEPTPLVLEALVVAPPPPAHAAAALASPSILRLPMYCAGKAFKQQAVAVSADAELIADGSGSGGEAFVMRCTGVPGVPPRLLHQHASAHAASSRGGLGPDRHRGGEGDHAADGVRWLHSSRHVQPHAQSQPQGAAAGRGAAAVMPAAVALPALQSPSKPFGLSSRIPLAVARSATGGSPASSRHDAGGANKASVRGGALWVHPALLEAAESGELGGSLIGSSDEVGDGATLAAAYRPLSSRERNPAQSVFGADDTFGNLTPHVFLEQDPGSSRSQ